MDIHTLARSRAFSSNGRIRNSSIFPFDTFNSMVVFLISNATYYGHAMSVASNIIPFGLGSISFILQSVLGMWYVPLLSLSHVLTRYICLCDISENQLWRLRAVVGYYRWLSNVQARRCYLQTCW